MKKLKILYEDKDLIVVSKPSKLLTIKDNKGSKNLYSEAYNYLHKKREKVFVVHRLDKDTSGIVLFAKSEKVKKILQDEWDKVTRKYFALVEGNIPTNGEIETYLEEDRAHYVHVTKNRGKYAKTIYEVKENYHNKTLLIITLVTGRKNQIRAHLAYIGHPIIGDKKYLSKTPSNRLMLHAYFLEFHHPITKKKITIIDDVDWVAK